STEDLQQIVPYQTLAAKIGSLQMQLARGAVREGRPITAIEVIFHGDFAGLPTAPITRSVLQGGVTPLLSDPVNLANAPYLPGTRGIKVVESHCSATPDHTCLLSVRAHLCQGERTICGTVYDGEPHIVHIDGYHVDILPSGSMIITQHNDRPGI